MGQPAAGHHLHQLLCLAAAYLVLQTPRLTAGIFAQERREQTLGLLFLSGLGASEVFASKLLSAALVAFGDLLALFPMLAVPFLIGGVSFELFLATICAWPIFLVFVLAVCLLASVLTRDDGTAVILTAVLLFLLCGAGPLIYVAHSQFSAAANLSSAWLWVSPAYGPYLTWRGFGLTPVSEFWNNLVVTMAGSGLCLTLAAVVVKITLAGTGAGLRGQLAGARAGSDGCTVMLAAGAGWRLPGWRQIHSFGWPRGTGNPLSWPGWWRAASSPSGSAAGRRGQTAGPACRTFSSPRRC